MIKINITDKEATCANCKHYVQHYVQHCMSIDSAYMMPCNCGHCVYPRVKSRKPGDVCEKFSCRIGQTPTRVFDVYKLRRQRNGV